MSYFRNKRITYYLIFIIMNRTILLKMSLLSVLGFAVSCVQQEEHQDGLVLAQEEITVPFEGDTVEVAYSLYGAASDQLKVIPQSDWITGIDLSEAGTIKFVVAGSDDRTERETTLLATVPGYNITEELSVVQSGGDIPDFNIEIKEVLHTRVYYNVTPYDKDATYMLLGTSADRFENVSSDDDIYALDQEYFEVLADLNGITVEDAIGLLLKTGNARNEQLNTGAGTDYVIYAYGMTADGIPTTPVAQAAFTTPELEIISPDFTFTTDINGSHVTLTVEPETDELYYFYGVQEKSAFDEDLIMESQQQFLDEMLPRWETNTWKTLEEAVKELTIDGTAEELFDLEPEKDYIAYAATVSSTGLINSELVTYGFTTEPVQPSDNQISLEITNVGYNQVRFDITVTNNDLYKVGAIKKSETEGLSDEQIIEKLLSPDHVNTLREYNRSTSAAFFNLESETEYLLCAFGYEFETVTTGLTKCEFRTTAKN